MSENHHRREGDRRQVHEECTAHSGVSTKLNINVALNGIAILVLSFLLTVAIDTNAFIKSQEWRLERQDKDMAAFEERLASHTRANQGHVAKVSLETQP